jgi:hypothetical protein
MIVSLRLLDLLSRRRTWIRILVGLVVLLAIIYLGFVAILPIDHDEVEHTHAAFKMLSGKIPYRDFYQNHLPAYWLLGMQLIRAFPFSVNAILAGRAINLIALAGCWLLGLRLLGSIRGGRTWFGISIYTIAIITLACEMHFHEVRPDPIMALIATAGLCLIPTQGSISNTRALLLGLLFGLSISVSIKVIPMVLVIPALIGVHCIRDRRLRPAQALFSYGIGALLMLLPTMWWIFHHGLSKAFYFDVISLNKSLSKPWNASIGYLLIPVFPISLLGLLALLGACRRRLNSCANAPFVIELAMAAGLAIVFLSRHPARYNLQAFIVPIALGFVYFVLTLSLHLHIPAYQLLLCAALIGYPAIHVEDLLVTLKNKKEAIPQHDLQILMDLAKPGNRTCTAFSPSHPVFCHDVSGLSNGWDLFFPEIIRDPKQLERFHRLWHDGIHQTLVRQPDIILRESPHNCWERAVKAGLVTPEELKALDALRPAYDVKRIGLREVWVRRTNMHKNLAE